MYSSKKNVQVLISLLKAHGVRHAVLSPGSRNMAIVASIEDDPDFTCYSVVDERSAAYFAIGVSTANGNAPVLLSCTSAQATRNYIPAMTEAYYRGTPLVVVTADFAPSRIGQNVMQAVNQLSVPRDAAKISIGLPLVKDDDDEAYCARLVNEAMLELFHHGSGPVHINIPVDEHWDGGVEHLPPHKKIDRYTSADSLPPLTAQRILVAVGSHAPFSPDEEDALSSFALHYDAVVYTNHLSNFHGANAVNASLLIENLSQKQLAEYRPDLIITIGGQIGDYAFDGVARSTGADHWRVHLDGAVRDTYGHLTKVFELPDAAFFRAYLDHADVPRNTGFYDKWRKGNAQRVIPSILPLSHAFVAATLAPLIPKQSVLHFAILSAFRNWTFFELDESVEGYSNVAAFGIDGCLSAFLGHASATARPCFLVIGDLSFFYDMNAIGIRDVTPNARIILVNNGGGGEFRLYSHAADKYFGDGANRHIAAAGHHGSARAWVESMGWEYAAVRSKSELIECSEAFVSPSDRPMLLEIFTTMNDDSDGVRIIREANTIETLEQRIGKMLPPGVKRVAKTVLGR